MIQLQVPSSFSVIVIDFTERNTVTKSIFLFPSFSIFRNNIPKINDIGSFGKRFSFGSKLILAAVNRLSGYNQENDNYSEIHA